jgi:cytochrome c peroxidase
MGAARIGTWLALLTCAAAGLLFALDRRVEAGTAAAASADAFGLPPLALPADVVVEPARVELGRKLFFDRRLSFNGTMSCAMCHVPEEGFASNASRTGVGIEGKSLLRNAPSLLNVAWQRTLFHDGRESSLVTQAWMPLLHPDEMANPSIGAVLDRLRALPDYRGRFERVFGGAGPSMNTLGEALAAFEATLVAADSRFDQWRYGGDAQALSEVEQRGWRLFSGKAGCVACHSVNDRHALLADGKFHVTGVGFTPPARSYVVPLAPGVQTELTSADLAAFTQPHAPDVGRFDITLDQADRYAFKTPSLRNVAHSAPYMHDGSLASLEAVVEFYDRGGGGAPGQSELIRPLALDAEDRRALVAFLRALDGSHLTTLVARVRQGAGQDAASPP